MIRLANMPMPHVTTTVRPVLDVFRASTMTGNMQCAAPTPAVIHRQSAAFKTQAAFISPADWNDLFLAVQTRLETCVGDNLKQAALLPLQDQKLMVKNAVLESVEALRHLHQSLLLERQSQQRH